MSFTTVVETSIDAKQGRTFQNDIEIVEGIVFEHGPIVGADIIQHLNENQISPRRGVHAADKNITSRLGDCQKLVGAIRKNGLKSEAKSSGRMGYEWVHVPLDPKLRLQARLEYWREALRRHTKEVAKAEQVLQRDRDNIAALEHVLHD
jgi:hypothetical protein